jgi:hypothetical protein
LIETLSPEFELGQRTHGSAGGWGIDASGHGVAGVSEGATLVLAAEVGEDGVAAGGAKGGAAGGGFDEAAFLAQIDRLAIFGFEVAGGDILGGLGTGGFWVTCLGGSEVQGKGEQAGGAEA